MAVSEIVWTPDLLGEAFTQTTLELGSDAYGDVVATLVRRMPSFSASLFGALRDVDVLYLHGWSDYFFQTELASFFAELGARFYALDLRRYGRSIRDGDVPGYVSNLDDYDADISAARRVMGAGGGARRFVLLGHSTGGLTATLWAARYPGVADAVVLNSPWLELQLGSMARQALAPLVGLRGAVDPLGALPAVDFGFYTRAQRELGVLPTGAERAMWRPDRGFAAHPGWLSAVMAGHAKIAAGVETAAPTMVLLSQRSAPPFAWSEAMTSSDGVLVVDDIARAATKIGSEVTVGRVDGALHDVFVSAPEARARAYRMLRRWLLSGALR